MNTSAITEYRTKRKHKMSMEAFGRMFEPPLNKSTVSRWEAGGVPAERLAEISRITGISVRKLRPDIFYGKGSDQ